MGLPMTLDDEILSRIRAAMKLDQRIQPSDFQLRAAGNGSVLINRKTGKAQLIYDEDSDLQDIQDLLAVRPRNV